MRCLISSLVIALVASSVHAGPMLGAKSTVYVHSNDTMKLELRQGTRLFGMPGSTHALEFQFSNEGMASHFLVRNEGSDGFNGLMKEKRFYLGAGMQKTITVSGLTVPQRPEDTKVSHTVTVTRDLSSIAKREAPPSNPNYGNDDSNTGGYGGAGGYGGSGSYDGSGSYPGNNGGNQYPDIPSVIEDPTYRREIALEVEFTVTEELSDESKPEHELTYGAKSDDETCPVDHDDANCNMYLWWVRVTVEDKKSGLYMVDAEPLGASTEHDEIFYRYKNFAVGTNQEQEITAAASCCLEGMEIRVTDMMGNTAEVEATNGGKGTPMKSSLKWGLIGGGIALLIIIIVVIVVCMKKGGYSRAATS